MSIDAIEDNSDVRKPDGRIGQIRVTRRERKMISDGKDIDVKVCDNGICGSYLFSTLEEIPYEEPAAEGSIHDCPVSIKEINDLINEYNLPLGDVTGEDNSYRVLFNLIEATLERG